MYSLTYVGGVYMHMEPQWVWINFFAAFGQKQSVSFGHFGIK